MTAAHVGLDEEKSRGLLKTTINLRKINATNKAELTLTTKPHGRRLNGFFPRIGEERFGLNLVPIGDDQENASPPCGVDQGCLMSLETPPTTMIDLPLQRAERSSGDPADMAVYVLLPSLEELLGLPDFGHRDPIFLPGYRRPLDGWALFGSVAARGLPIH